VEKLVLLGDNEQSARLTKIAHLLGIQAEITQEVPTQPARIILSGSAYDQYASQLEEHPHTVLVYDAGASVYLAAQLKTLAHSSDRVAITSA
jgi:hypothetical protein